MKINLLEPKVYNRISAGEVVERQASIVKELVENSIDAGATKIMIEIENGGIKEITISDNGCGIGKEDIRNAFMPHATSKIKSVDDLDNIESLGFRGEALASIASVCHVQLTSKTADSDTGYSIKVDGGVFSEVSEVARVNGTTITCADIFYNTPVRARFLRRPKIEESEVTHLIEKIMLSHSDIAFVYYVDGKMIYNTTSCVMQDIIYTIYGREVYDNLVAVDYEEDGYKLTGFITKPNLSKSNRTYQSLFVNGRYVENFLVSSAVQGVFESFLMKGRFPIYVLSLTLPTDCVDVNVHPSKREVKFENSGKIFGIVRRAVEKALLSINQIVRFISNDEEPMQDERSEFNSQSFNPYYKKENELLSENQGSSYHGTIELDDGKEPLPDVNPYDIAYKKPEQKKITGFDDLQLIEKDVPINKRGGPFFFDNDNEQYLNQIKSGKKENVFATVKERPVVTEEKFLSADVESEMKILGTIFNTYITVEYDDSIYFLDQHAGHERILYDKLVSAINDNKSHSQPLLIPFAFTVNAREYQKVESIVQILNKMGFKIKDKGNSTFEIVEIPYALGELRLDKFVEELVSEIPAFDKKPSEFINDKLCQHACKHAIKGGDRLSKDDCAYLIEEVRKGVMLCPHGRPISLVMTRKQFEKMFKRVL